ncbi:unnamed protein product [Thelazia callipaeda]|uniref:Uncharacterized protein n=1 Tax=Thelazia callipaeda TaxID=103827 RepID=A0A0N5D9G0_THECL|nr:unnamed protein product [Thelazia callipaeda]
MCGCMVFKLLTLGIIYLLLLQQDNAQNVSKTTEPELILEKTVFPFTYKNVIFLNQLNFKILKKILQETIEEVEQEGRAVISQEDRKRRNAPIESKFPSLQSHDLQAYRLKAIISFSPTQAV